MARKKRAGQRRRGSAKGTLLRRSLLKVALALLVLAVFAVVYMDAWLVEKLQGRKWSQPAVVYARPLELFEGREIAQADVVHELQASGYREDGSGTAGSFREDGNTLTVFQRRFYLPGGVQPEQVVTMRFEAGRVAALRVSSGKGFSVRLEPLEVGRIHPGQSEDRLLVSIDQVPQSLIDALLVTEDRNFYSHWGISLRSIARAMFSNVREGEVVQGGSTLTQQLVKNFFTAPERSYSRKLVEAVMAVLLELHASKNDILEAYINEVFVAQSGTRAIHGFGLASQYLFGLPVAQLDVHQSALLVAMMKGPSYYHPVNHPERALERRNLVIRLMAEQKKISPALAAKAMRKPLGLLSARDMPDSYPAYLDLVRRDLRRDYSEKTLATEGLRIFSNMDPEWQWRAQRQLQLGIARLEKQHGANVAGIDGGVVVVDSVTSDVLAVVGGKTPRVSGFNRAIDARRPIGSLVKPAIYLTALEKGYHLMSPLSDDPLRLKTRQGEWRPQNFDQTYHGQVPFYLALANSYNVASVRLGLDVGIRNVNKTLLRLGIERPLPELPAVMLGAIDLSPLEVAQAYSTIAANGFYSPLKSIREVTDKDGNPLKRYPFRLERRFEADVMHLLDFGLQTVMHEGTGRSALSAFSPNSVVAGKTGTTNDQRDSWFAGYDTNKVAVVWLGTDDNLPLPVTGSTGALPVWAGIIAANINSGGRTNVPENIHYLWVDKTTGNLSSEYCAGSVYLPFRQGTEPKQQSECIMTTPVIIHWFKKWFQ